MGWPGETSGTSGPAPACDVLSTLMFRSLPMIAGMPALTSVSVSPERWHFAFANFRSS